MQEWQFVFTKEVEMDLRRLDSSTRKRVLEKIKWMQENFNQIIPLPLGSEWRGFFKLRIGDWRVIYEIEALKRLIAIHCIDHRNKIYKRK